MFGGSDRRKSRSTASNVILNERSEVKNLGNELMLNGAESIEDSAPLLAFYQFELYRTFVRRRIQIVKI